MKITARELNKRAKPASGEITEAERRIPIFVWSELDDLGLTVEQFRVYAHLARRAGKDGKAFPTYKSIGEKCFRPNLPNAKEESLQRKAKKAVKELRELGLISVEFRKRGKTNRSNSYVVHNLATWPQKTRLRAHQPVEDGEDTT